jgi:dTDP-4-dehydrorhamnose reductase
MTIIIVGGDGEIGRALAGAMGHRGAIVTTRRLPTGNRYNNRYGLDLSRVANDAGIAENFVNNVVQKKNGVVAYLAAAISGYQQCEENPVGTEIVNVVANATLAQALIRRGVHIVFLSSGGVFSGEHDSPEEKTFCDPISEYGRQKASLETSLLEMAKGTDVTGSVAIVRLTKVLSERTPRISGWIRDLCAGRSIEAALDLKVSPVSLQNAIYGLIRIGSERRAGVYHLSGDRNLPWYSIGVSLAVALGCSEKAVRPIELADRSPSVYLPRYAKLGMTSTSSQVGLEPESLEHVVRAIVRAIGRYV